MTPDQYSDIGDTQQDVLTGGQGAKNRVRDHRDGGGSIQFAKALFTIGSTLPVADDTIGMIWLPEGVEILPHLSRFYTDETDGTFDVGLSADPDGLFNDLDFSANVEGFFSEGVVKYGSLGVTNVEDGGDWLILTCVNATGLTAGKIIAIDLAYQC